MFFNHPFLLHDINIVRQQFFVYRELLLLFFGLLFPLIYIVIIIIIIEKIFVG